MKHTEIARELFSKKYYCSQAVLIVEKLMSE